MLKALNDCVALLLAYSSYVFVVREQIIDALCLSVKLLHENTTHNYRSRINSGAVRPIRVDKQVANTLDRLVGKGIAICPALGYLNWPIGTAN